MESMDEVVLVGVVKDQRDLDILQNKGWYRIPIENLPKKKFTYIALYQPLIFGKSGKCIKYYGEVTKITILKRNELLPDEPEHPRARNFYIKIKINKLLELQKPVRNIIPRRVIFGFTTIRRLINASDILELYDISATEQIIEKAMLGIKIKAIAQYYELIDKKKRFRLDFAIFCKNGKIALECDNKKAHSGKIQTSRDNAKDRILESHGWIVVRFEEEQILSDLVSCLNRINKLIKALGGQ